MFKTSYLVVTVLLVMLLSVGLMGCPDPEEVEPEPEPEPNDEKVEVEGEINIAMVDWACAEASSYVAKAVLEDMGYDVDITSVEAGVMYTGLAAGDEDMAVCSWLPITHESYMDEYGDDLVEVATHFEGARIGLAVPTYMEDLNSVEDVDEFVDEIEGIDSGAGVMEATDKAIETYGLDVDLQVGSDATMVAELRSAIEREDDIVVTGWAPHWKLGEWDLKFLDDPELVYGEEERIANIARQNLEEDKPEAYEFLENFTWGDEEIGEVMEMNEEDPDDLDGNAQEWIENNQDIVEEWTP